MRVLIQHADKHLHVASFNGLARLRVYLAGILVAWIVRKVATHHKQVLWRKVRLQRAGYALQLRIVVGRYDDRHYGRHLLHPSLQEGQLHLQTVLAVVRLRAIGQYAVGLYQRRSHLAIHFHAP